MAKVGRNESCPCGSGRKYKKCCLHADERAASASREPSPAQLPETLGLNAHTLARIFEGSDELKRIARTDPKRAETFWTIRRVAALDTAEIVQRLAELGIRAEPESFRRLAAEHTSAWALSNVWRERRVGRALRDREDDLIGLAACELWKRWYPDEPSVEMLDDWMQDGYAHLEEGRSIEACERWQAVWDVIDSRLTPEMRTCEAATPVFEGLQHLFNWLQDFAIELQNAGGDRPDVADRGVTFCRRVLDQFTDETPLFRSNFRCDLADLQDLAGRPEAGEQTLLQLIEDEPDKAAGYARLADLLARNRGPDAPPPDRKRALALLEEGRRRATDAAQWDLDDRIAWMLEESGRV